VKTHFRSPEETTALLWYLMTH